MVSTDVQKLLEQVQDMLLDKSLEDKYGSDGLTTTQLDKIRYNIKGDKKLAEKLATKTWELYTKAEEKLQVQVLPVTEEEDNSLIRNPEVKAANIKANEDAKEFYDAFDLILSDDTPDSGAASGVTSNSAKLFAKTSEHVNGQGAFEALLTIAFNGITGDETTARNGENKSGSTVAVGTTISSVAATVTSTVVEFVSSKSAANSTNKWHIDGTEARALWFLNYWQMAGNMDPIVLFGNKAHTISVAQWALVGGNEYCYCGTYATSTNGFTTKRFNIFDNSAAGRMAYIHATAAMIKYEGASSGTSDASKMLGGEGTAPHGMDKATVLKFLSSEIRNDLVNGFTNNQIRTVFALQTSTTRRTTVAELDSLYLYGLTALSNIDIAVDPSATFGSMPVVGTDSSASEALAYFALVSGNDEFKNGGSTASDVNMMNGRVTYGKDAPYINTIIESKYGPNFLNKLIMKNGELDHTNGLLTALALGYTDDENSILTANNASGKETTTAAYRASTRALELINKVLNEAGKESTTWLEILESHNDNSEDDEAGKIQIPTSVMSFFTGRQYWPTGLTAATTPIDPDQQSKTLYHQLVYWDRQAKFVLDSENNMLTSKDLVVSSLVKSQNASVINEPLKHAIKSNLLNDLTSFPVALTKLVGHADTSTSGYGALGSADILADLHVVFGADASSTSASSQKFGNPYGASKGPSNFANSKEGLAHDLALATFNVISQLDADEKKKVYVEDNFAALGQLMVPLLEVVGRKTDYSGSVTESRVKAKFMTDISEATKTAAGATPFSGAGNYIDSKFFMDLAGQVVTGASATTEMDLTESKNSKFNAAVADAITKGLQFSIYTNHNVSNKLTIRLKVINRIAVCAKDIVDVAEVGSTQLSDFAATPGSAFALANTETNSVIASDDDYTDKVFINAVMSNLVNNETALFSTLAAGTTAAGTSARTDIRYFPIAFFAASDITKQFAMGDNVGSDQPTQGLSKGSSSSRKVVDEVKDIVCNATPEQMQQLFHALVKLGDDQSDNAAKYGKEGAIARTVLSAFGIQMHNGPLLNGLFDSSSDSKPTAWVETIHNRLLESAIDHIAHDRIGMIKEMGNEHYTNDRFQGEFSGTLSKEQLVDVYQENAALLNIAKNVASLKMVQEDPSKALKEVAKDSATTAIYNHEMTRVAAVQHLLSAYILAMREHKSSGRNVLEDGESQPAGLTLDMINHLLEHGDMTLFELGQIVQPVVLESGVGTVYSVKGMPVKVVATDADGMPVVPAGYSEGNPVYEPIPVTDLWGNAARYN